MTYDVPYPMLPRRSWERELRNKGLCIIKGCEAVAVEAPNVQVEETPVIKGTKKIVTTTYQKPVGSVSEKVDMTKFKYCIEQPFGKFMVIVWL